MATRLSGVKKKRKKKVGGSSSGSASGSSSSAGAGVRGGESTGARASGVGRALTGGREVNKRRPRPKIPVQKQLRAPVHRGGGGFRGTFFTSNRPTAARGGAAASRRAPRTPSGRTFDAAARARIAAAQARGGAAGDVFEILIKTYSEEKRDALAEAFIEVLVEEIPVGETGVLVDSAHLEDATETTYTATARVVVDAPYAQYVNDGSDAVDGKLMVWESDDGTVFATRRRAIPANPFWERALARWSEVVASV